jgi:uncharacterized membrane protein YdjX (TVP38/TMEM64 family)
MRNLPPILPKNPPPAVLKFLIFIIALSLIWFLGTFFHIDSQEIEYSLRKFPLIYSGLIFIFLYVIVTFFIWLSKDVFRLAAAILFGGYLSTVFVCIAETINAFVLFYFARYFGRGFVESSLQRSRRGLDERLTNVNFFWLFMFRFVPFIPLRFLDLAVGLTNISFRRYLLVVILGSPLRILWVQYILANVGRGVLKDPLLLAEYISQDKTFLIFSFAYTLLIILVALKLKKKGKP